MRIAAEGDGIVVQEDGTTWSLETGQARFNFDVANRAERVAAHAGPAARAALDSEEHGCPDSWCALAADLESAAPDHAIEAYRRALDLDPDHFETRVGLGRLLHARGRLHAAETHFRLALGVRPADSSALLYLALCLEDLGRTDEALRAHQEIMEAEPDCADAYYHAARLFEALGDPAAAARHLHTYRQLTETP
jgi:tetratricopeptide (TPR) repeat protein